MKSRSDSNLYLIDMASGGEALLTPHEPPGTFNGCICSPDGRTGPRQEVESVAAQPLQSACAPSRPAAK